LAKQLFGYAILGFALTEAIALFSLMMAFLILLVFSKKKIKEWKRASPRKCPVL
jgi:F-type H+-transporting ATPase subunit c